MTSSYCVLCGLALVRQPLIAPKVALDGLVSSPAQTPCCDAFVRQTPGTPITAWSPRIELNRFVISAMLLAGPAHAWKAGVLAIAPREGGGSTGVVAKMLP